MFASVYTLFKWVARISNWSYPRLGPYDPLAVDDTRIAGLALQIGTC